MIGFVRGGGMWGDKVCIVWNGKGIEIRVCGYGGSDRWNEAWRGRDGGGRSDATGAVGRTRAMGWDGTGRDDGLIRRRARGSGTRVETVTGGDGWRIRVVGPRSGERARIDGDDREDGGDRRARARGEATRDRGRWRGDDARVRVRVSSERERDGG